MNAAELLQRAAVAATMSPSINIWPNLVTDLAGTIHADWALVGKLLPGSQTLARTLAVCHRQKIVENFDYSIDPSPSPNRQSGDIHLYAGAASGQLRRAWLKRVRAEAFGEVTLIDSLGQARGILAFAHPQPLEREDLIAPVLKIFALKAAVELERELADDRFYRELLDGLRQHHSP